MPKIKDIPELEARKNEQRSRNKRSKDSKDLVASFESKKFDELQGNEKDILLKAVALRLHMISPD